MPPLIICTPYYVTAGEGGGGSTGIYSDTIIADTPLIYYRMGDSSGTTMTDSSGNSHDGTYISSPTLGAVSLLPGDTSDTAVTFSSGADVASIPSGVFPTGSAAKSIECWCKPSALPTEQIMVTFGYTSQHQQFFIGMASTGTQFRFGFNQNDLNYSTTINIGQTYHVVMTWDGTNRKGYVDGVLVASDTPTAANTSDQVGYVARHATGYDGAHFQGTIDEVAAYDFALTADQVLDHYNAGLKEVALLMHSNTTNGSTVFTDSSFNSHSFTASGNPSHSTAQAKFGTTSIYFDGNDYLYTPITDDLQMGSSDFTIDFWYYPTSSGNQYLISASQYGSDGWVVGHQSGYIYFLTQGAGVNVLGTTTVPLNQWNHVAVTRRGTTAYIFLNGVLDTSGTVPSTITDTSRTHMSIGRARHLTGDWNADFYTTGYIDELHILKGEATWTSGFTPPTSAYSDPVGTSGPGTIQLLVHSDTTDMSTTFTDSSTNGITLTPYNASIYHSTEQAKFGSTSIKFNAGSKIDGSDALFNVGTGDFTIDLWVYMTASATNGGFFATGTVGTTAGLLLSMNGTTTQFGVGSSSGGADLLSGLSIPLNTWTHWAVVRSSGTLYQFKNGIESGTVASTRNLTSTTFSIGGRYSNSASWMQTNAYFDEIRFTDEAVWTADFTPPTAAYA